MPTKKVVTPENLHSDDFLLDAASQKIRVKPGARMYYGADADPSNLTFTPTPKDGDFYTWTNDGSPSGVKLALWVRTGDEWKYVSDFTRSIGAGALGVRDYHGSLAVLDNNWTSPLSAAAIAAKGFAAVGPGASVADFGATYGPYRMLRFTAVAAATSAGGTYTVPMSYVRHEVPIVPGKDNAYMLQALTGGAVRELTIEAWVCHPVAGVPARRLYALHPSQRSDTNGAMHGTCALGPTNGTGAPNGYSEWMTWLIPADVVDRYKTSDGKLKIALRPGRGNGESTLFHIYGYAVTELSHSLLHLPAMVMENAANEVDAYDAADGGNAPTLHSDYGGYSLGVFYAPQSRVMLLPVPTIDKDLYFTVLSRMLAGTDGSPTSVQRATYTLLNGTFSYDLKPMRPEIVGPLFKHPAEGLRAVGTVVPANVLAAAAFYPRANSALRYVRMRVTVPSFAAVDFIFGAMGFETVE